MNILKCEKIIFFVLLNLFFSTALRAQEQNIFKGYTVTVGIAAKETSFNYYRSDTDANPAGTATEGMYYTYSLRAGSPQVLSENKKWGYYFETGFSNFSTTKQNVGLKEKDLGTSVTGNYWYLTPMGIYRFGEPQKSKNDIDIILGIGVGIGYLSAKGDLILTEDGSNELHKVNIDGFDLAGSMVLEARYQDWVSRIYGGGPFLYQKSSIYSAFEFTWDIGYVITF